MTDPIKFNLLLVEDQEDDALLILREIRKNGFEPAMLRVDTSDGFTKALAENKWDLILCDYVVPGFGALEAIKSLASRGVDASLVVISGKVGEDIAVEAMRHGAADYILKSNLKRLPGIVERELREVKLRRERKKTEQDKKRLEEQLRRAQKMEAIGTLAGGIAHDFNNILGAILGFTELALKKLDRQLPAREDLYQVRASTFRARELVKQILAFGRNGATQFANVRLQGVIEEGVQLLRASLPSTIEFETEIQADAPPVHCDSTQMLQILLNLGTNAMQAMSAQGGTFSLKFEERLVQEELATQVAGLLPGRYVCLSLRDSGCGIPNHLIERIFDPFFTTKAPGVGTGLGLWTVRQIVTASGGAIRVQSVPGKYTQFEIFLPVATSAGLEGSVPAPKKPIARLGGGKHILVADDEGALLELHRITLEEFGFRVTSVSDGQQAFEIFRTDPSGFALLLSDETMPGLTGSKLIEKVWTIRPNMGVILSTGLGNGPTLLKSADNCKVLSKPYTLDSLMETVFSIIDASGKQKNQI